MRAREKSFYNGLLDAFAFPKSGGFTRSTARKGVFPNTIFNYFAAFSFLKRAMTSSCTSRGACL